MTIMTIEKKMHQLVEGDKIRFLVHGIGIFVGYVKYLTKKAISLKGCKLVNIHDSVYKMNNVDLSYYRENHAHTFLSREIGNVEVLEKAPF